MNKTLENKLRTLNLTWIRDNLDEEVANAIRLNHQPHDLLERLIEGELETRYARSVERRLRQAKLPAQPTLQTYDFHWPSSINSDQLLEFNLF